MIEAVSSREIGHGLPGDLKTAQAAILLPEVQEMLERLAHHKLGIFMPHRHDERTGEFEVLPDGFAQVESGLEVSFRTLDQVERDTARFMPVGWLWRHGSVTASAACEMVAPDGSRDAEPVKHKMPPAGRRGAEVSR